MAGPNAGMTSTVTAISATTGTYAGQVNQVNMHSREKSNGYANAHQSNFDDVVIAAPSSWSGTGGSSWSGANWTGATGICRIRAAPAPRWSSASPVVGHGGP